MKGSGQLRGYAIDIISDICAYQQAKDLDTNTAEVSPSTFEFESRPCLIVPSACSWRSLNIGLLMSLLSMP